ncbi:DUF1998 domain-containing protein [Bifidobacterium leontopitheci]|uniref:MrfA-like Zn-binding domain-containing protein n=1 Tax=Bifidobacterium leontopitheci TaxID=2650774 RepID=A0A6I1GEI5_9BIFI|nr:DUF1998 domain-containing protein [Bifidobacterium leontopitheci]KAB7790044.1 hypothetical protein F7D09_1464 [Bifidobacterium leontopitheci]
MSEDNKLVYDADAIVDPLGDDEAQDSRQKHKNYAKVGSSRSSTLLYTYGPGAIMDLPHFTVMPMGLEAWDRVWSNANSGIPDIHAPRLLESVRIMLGRQVQELRPFPRETATSGVQSQEGGRLGVPARVFPQWLRRTGCNKLAPVADFVNGYRNVNRYRPDQAQFMHLNCAGNGKGKRTARLCIPARYLLVCPNGHVDEFPYDWWVHYGERCASAPDHPQLRMYEGPSGASMIECKSCGKRRSMSEAQGQEGQKKLPKCRGRFPHLNSYDEHGCNQQVRLMLIGASNLWFPVTQSIIDMPRLDEAKERQDLYDELTKLLYENGNAWMLEEDDYDGIFKTISHHPKASAPLKKAITSPVELQFLINHARAEEESTEKDRQERRKNWDPSDLRVPEWTFLQRDLFRDRYTEPQSGITVHKETVAPAVSQAGITRILGVDKLRKVNALLGFTRIDDFERANDIGHRLVGLTHDKPQWVPATEDLGEGVFIQLDEEKVAKWEQHVLRSSLWDAHREAHKRNFYNRFSNTSKDIDPDDRMPQPRYWLVHTLSHALIKTMAMSAGYGIPSLNERIYAWPAKDDDRPAAIGVLIATTASDSDGTLGGLVSLAEPDSFERIFNEALQLAHRCSSDPVCAQRVPQDPEDFLHGAACHCCCMLSETSCERANRFLDRRFLVPLPGEYADLAFFGD